MKKSTFKQIVVGSICAILGVCLGASISTTADSKTIPDNSSSKSSYYKDLSVRNYKVSYGEEEAGYSHSHPQIYVSIFYPYPHDIHFEKFENGRVYFVATDFRPDLGRLYLSAEEEEKPLETNFELGIERCCAVLTDLQVFYDTDFKYETERIKANILKTELAEEKSIIEFSIPSKYSKGLLCLNVYNGMDVNF